MKNIMDYSEGNSIFHKMNPVTKIVMSFLICVACFLSDNIIFLAAIVVLDLCVSAAAGVFGKTFAVFKGLLKVCTFLFVLQLLFVQSGNRLFLFVTDEGVLLASKIVLRLIGATLPLTIMLAVTKMTDLSNALVSVLHVPYKYAFTLTTALRFIPLFMHEMDGIMEAQTARGIEFDTKNIFKKLKLILPLCVPLLINSVKKADSSAISAEIRGFNLRHTSSGYKKYNFKMCDVVSTMAIFMLVAGAYTL